MYLKKIINKTIFQKIKMNCSSQRRDEVATEPQEDVSTDEGLLDRASDKEVKEQEEEVDRASKRMHQSKDGDV